MDRLMQNDFRRYFRGFTAIEIIVVVVIIAVAAVMAIPMLSSARGMQARSAAGAIAADLEYARSMAVTRQQKYAVVFDKFTERYWIEDEGGNVIGHPVKKGFDYIVDFSNSRRLSAVDILEADFDSTSKIEFDYLGSPFNGVGGALGSGVVTLQAGGETMTVTVSPVTGYIAIQ